MYFCIQIYFYSFSELFSSGLTILIQESKTTKQNRKFFPFMSRKYLKKIISPVIIYLLIIVLKLPFKDLLFSCMMI